MSVLRRTAGKCSRMVGGSSRVLESRAGRERRSRKQWVVGVIGLAALMLSSCGGASSSGAGTGHPRGHGQGHHVPVTKKTVTKKTTGSGSTSSGSGRPSSGHSNGSGASGITQAGGLELSSLSSLGSYTFEAQRTRHGSSSSSMYLLEVSGRVHSPTDWQATYTGLKNDTPLDSTYYDVDGTGYVDSGGAVSSVAFRSPEGTAHLYGEAYFAEKLLSDIKDRGLKLTSARGCYVAGIPGKNYYLGNPPGSSAIEQGNVCIANGSGALVQYFLRWPLGPSATASTDVEISSFSITGVNNVPAISAP